MALFHAQGPRGYLPLGLGRKIDPRPVLARLARRLQVRTDAPAWRVAHVRARRAAINRPVVPLYPLRASARVENYGYAIIKIGLFGSRKIRGAYSLYFNRMQ